MKEYKIKGGCPNCGNVITLPMNEAYVQCDDCGEIYHRSKFKVI